MHSKDFGLSVDFHGHQEHEKIIYESVQISEFAQTSGWPQRSQIATIISFNSKMI